MSMRCMTNLETIGRIISEERDKSMKAIAMIGGFTEQIFDITGSRKIYNSLARKYGSDYLVEFAEWHDCESLAEYMEEMEVTEILVGAYSWGAGQGLRDLARNFSGKIYAVLCDPVFRSRFPWMRWRAITRLRFWHPTIKYPDNVHVIGWFNQKMDVPRGSHVKAKVRPRKPITLPLPHTQIDDSPQYRKLMLDAAKKFTQ